MYRDFGPRKSRSGFVSLFRSLIWFCQGITEHSLKAAEKNAFFVTLRRLAGSHGRLPDSMMITEKIEVEEKILASGGFADVRRGTYMGHLVAVKTLRVAEKDDFLKIRKVSINGNFPVTWDAVLTTLQQFCKEAILWKTVSHPNILNFAGVQGDMEKGQFVTVSEWMEHGNIMEYIKKNHVNRLELVRDFTSPTTPFTQMRQ
jgi:serine/threonine protein kinase